ncbi:MAG: SpoIID/LytB domain-containing protein [Calditrichia bacterium]
MNRLKYMHWSGLKFGLMILLITLLAACTPRTSSPSKGSIAGEPLIKVALAEKLRSGRLTFQDNYELQLEEAVYRFDPAIKEMTIGYRGGRLVMQGERRYLEISEPQLLVFKPEAEDSKFLWNDVVYSGELQILFKDNRVTIINQLPLETYLRGVVPFEMPSGQPEYAQAVYAQTITARSFAFFRMNKPVSPDYHIRATVQDQVYLGMAKADNELVDKAIRGTRGLVLSENNNPTITQYHSNCGGMLLPSDKNTGEVINPVVRTDVNCRGLKNYRWSEQRNMDTILRNLGKTLELDTLRIKNWIDNGYTLSMNVDKRIDDSWITGMTVTVNEESFPISGFQIRRLFANEKGDPLLSNLFFMNASKENPRRLYITGGGFGHGKGMCQWGAIGMSVDRKQYSEILGFYYPDLSLKSLYR